MKTFLRAHFCRIGERALPSTGAIFCSEKNSLFFFLDHTQKMSNNDDVDTAMKVDANTLKTATRKQPRLFLTQVSDDDEDNGDDQFARQLEDMLSQSEVDEDDVVSVIDDDDDDDEDHPLSMRSGLTDSSSSDSDDAPLSASSSTKKPRGGASNRGGGGGARRGRGGSRGKGAKSTRGNAAAAATAAAIGRTADDERAAIEKKTRRVSSNIAKQREKLIGHADPYKAELDDARDQGIAEERERAEQARAEQARYAEELNRASNNESEVKALQEQVTKVAGELRDVQMEAVRAEARARVQQQIMLMPNTAGDIAKFFAEMRAQGGAAAGVPASVPLAMSSQYLGTALQQPEAASAASQHLPYPVDDLQKRAQRLEAEHAQAQAYLSTMQMNARAFYETLTLSNAMANTKVRLVKCDDVTVAQFEAQMIPPIGTLPPCVHRKNCVACSELIPRGDASKAPLKAWQSPADFELFLRDGTVVMADRLQNMPCGACLVFMYAEMCRMCIARNQPCDNIQFPFMFVVNRPGGLLQNAMIEHQNMPGMWLDACRGNFVPVQREVAYNMLDAYSNAVTAYKVSVWGYEFNTAIKYLSPDTNDRMTLRQVDPVHRLRGNTQEPSVPQILGEEARRHAAVANTLNGSDAPAAMRLRDALDLLCVDFAETLRRINAVEEGGDLERLYVRQFSVYFERVLALVGEAGRAALGSAGTWSLRTHSVLAALMWRVGFADALSGDFAMRGNHNLDNFYNAHTPLLKFVYEAWARLRMPPSDAQLTDNSVRSLNTNTLLAFLELRALMPRTGVPYLSAADIHKVPFHVTHEQRAVAMDTIRSHYLRAEVARASPQALLRAIMRFNSEIRLQRETGDEASLTSALFNTFFRPSTRLVKRMKKLATAGSEGDDSNINNYAALFHVAERNDDAVFRASLLVLCAMQHDFEDTAWLLKQLYTHLWPTIVGDVHMMCKQFSHPHVWAPPQPRSMLSATEHATASSDAPRLVRLTENQVLAREHFYCTALALRVYVLQMLLGELGEHNALRREHEEFNAEQRRSAAASTDAPTVPDHIFDESVSEAHHFMRAANAANNATSGGGSGRQKASTRAKAERPLQFRSTPTGGTAATAAAAVVDGEEVHSTVDEDNDATSSMHPDVDNDSARHNEDLIGQAVDALRSGDKDAIERVAQRIGASEKHSTLICDRVDICFQNCDFTQAPAVRTRYMGVQPSEQRELVYSLRCALFEHMSTTCRVDDAEQRGERVSDAWFLRAQCPLGTSRQCAGVVPCEDTMADLSPYMAYMRLMRDDGCVDSRRALIDQSWLSHIIAAMQLCCFIRDFGSKHQASCQDPQYLRWCAQSMLVGMLGTYRHALDGANFKRACEFYRALSPDYNRTVDEKKALMLRLHSYRYIALCAQREALMFALENAAALREILRRVWSNFAAVSQQWVPEVCNKMRRKFNDPTCTWKSCDDLMKDFKGSEDDGDEHDDAVGDEAHAASVGSAATANKIPRVFRRAKAPFMELMLARFSTAEIKRWTNIIISANGPRHSLPPLIDMPEALLVYAMDLARTMGSSLRMEIFARLGVSAHGQLLIYLANSVYAWRNRETAIAACMKMMSRPDFSRAWLGMHVMQLQLSTHESPLPEHVRARQYRAVVRRAHIEYGATPPQTFTHMFFCHPLGCNRPRNYFVPAQDQGNYNTDGTCFIAEYGTMACTVRGEKELFSPVARRTRDSDITATVRAYNSALQASMSGSGSNNDGEEARQRRLELQLSQHAMTVSQSKNVRSVVNIVWHLCCSSAPLRSYDVLGAVVHRSHIQARDSTQSFTLCPLCGAFTLYSMDRFDANGFVCGKCDRAERMLRLGAKCLGCQAVVPCTDLPLLSGEEQAQKRVMRSRRAKMATPTPTDQTTPVASNTKNEQATLKAQQKAKKRAAAAAAAAAAEKAAKERTPMDVLRQEAIDSADMLSGLIMAPAKSGAGTKRKSATAATNGSGTGSRSRRGTAAQNQDDAQALIDDGHVGAAIGELPHLRSRKDTLHSFLFYDDRRGVGTHELRQFNLCTTCRDRLPTNFSLISATEVLHCIKAAPSRIFVDGVWITVKHD